MARRGFGPPGFGKGLGNGRGFNDLPDFGNTGFGNNSGYSSPFDNYDNFGGGYGNNNGGFGNNGGGFGNSGGGFGNNGRGFGNNGSGFGKNGRGFGSKGGRSGVICGEFGIDAGRFNDSGGGGFGFNGGEFGNNNGGFGNNSGGCNNNDAFGNRGFTRRSNDVDGFNPTSAKTDSNPKPKRVNCGQLRKKHDGSIVEITGRLQAVNLGKFLVLKDTFGSTQLVATPSVLHRVPKIEINSNVTAIGTVRLRPAKQVKNRSDTGEIEVEIMEIVAVKRPALADELECTKKTKIIFEAEDLRTLTSSETTRCKNDATKNAFYERTHSLARLSVDLVGSKVRLCGWIHSKSWSYVQLKDGYSMVQCFFPNRNDEFDELKVNDVIYLVGTVKHRPHGKEAFKLDNGLIEIHVESVTLAENYVTHEPNEVNAVDDQSPINSFTMRTHCNDQVTIDDVKKNQPITVCGFIESFRAHRYVIVRDAYKSVQCVFAGDRLNELFGKCQLETVVRIVGVPTIHPANPITGTDEKLEIFVEDAEILGGSEKVTGFARNIVRLRAVDVQVNFRLRSKFVAALRNVLASRYGFVDVDGDVVFHDTTETLNEPYMTSQLLTIAGFDRHFNIKRSNERLHLNLAASYIDLNGMTSLTEAILENVCAQFNLKTPLKRITHAQAVNGYGTETPDLRFGFELKQFGDETAIEKFRDGTNGVYYMIIPDAYNFVSTVQQKQIAENFNVQINGLSLEQFKSEIKSNLGSISETIDKYQPKDYFLIASGTHENVMNFYQEIRTKLTDALAKRNVESTEKFAFVWVAQPFFHTRDMKIIAKIHPLVVGDVDAENRSESFALIVNGVNVGHVAGRVNDANVLEKTLPKLNVDAGTFHGLIDAMKGGCPPSCEFVLDIDRFLSVLLELRSENEYDCILKVR